jgi:hypothetical protein
LTSPKTAADWNALLTAEGMPAEVRPIPRRHAPRAAEATFEGDLDAAVLDEHDWHPAVRRPGRRPGYDVVAPYSRLMIAACDRLPPPSHTHALMIP